MIKLLKNIPAENEDWLSINWKCMKTALTI